jgi:hypothetical protein
MNTGKIFEATIQDSASVLGIDCTRFKDAGFMRQEKSEHKRFTIKNMCDFLLFNGYTLYYIEAKTGKTSIAFDRLTQQDALEKKRNKFYPNVKTGYLFEIKGKWFYLCSSEIEPLKAMTGKKSFNDKDLERSDAIAIPGYTPKRARKARLDLRVLD